MAATPLEASVGLNVTLTGETYQFAAPLVPDRDADATGGTVSGLPGPKSGAQATRGAPRPAPWVPFEAETVCHVERSQLSTTARAPKIRSMSRAQGTSRLNGLIGKPQAVVNSSSTFPEGLYSVAIAYTDHAASSTVYPP